MSVRIASLLAMAVAVGGCGQRDAERRDVPAEAPTASGHPKPLPRGTPTAERVTPRPSATPTGSTPPVAPWWGGPPSAPQAPIERALGPAGGISLGVPEGWRSVRLRDGMNDNALGSLVRSRDGLAFVLIQAVQADHDVLLDRRADAALRVSGGLASSVWASSIEAVEIGGKPATLKRGRGVLKGKRVELIQLRWPLSSARPGPRTVQLLGVVPEGATPLQRRRYVATLASLRL